jgi:hypothetical protein
MVDIELNDYSDTISELELDWARIMFELTEQPISVKFIKSFPGFDFGGVKIPPGSENSRLDLPYYIAEILLQEDLIEDFSDSFSLSLQDLTSAVRKEMRQGEVQSLHPYFYALLNKQFSNNKADSSHYDEIELKRQKDKVKQLVFERLSKILKFAEVESFDPQKMNLTASEAILMQRIHAWASSWKKLVTLQKE